MLPSTPPPSFPNAEPLATEMEDSVRLRPFRLAKASGSRVVALKEPLVVGLSRCDEDGRKPPSTGELEDAVDSRELDACTVVEVRVVAVPSCGDFEDGIKRVRMIQRAKNTASSLWARSRSARQACRTTSDGLGGDDRDDVDDDDERVDQQLFRVPADAPIWSSTYGNYVIQK